MSNSYKWECNGWPTSAATLPKVSSPSCRSEMRLQWAQSKRKRRHVRLAASSLTLASSKERFRRITAICSTRWASMSLIPGFRGGWKRLCWRSSHDVPSAKTICARWGCGQVLYNQDLSSVWISESQARHGVYQQVKTFLKNKCEICVGWEFIF